MLKCSTFWKAKFFIPVLYTVCTRTGNRVRFLSWVLSYVIPSALAFHLVSGLWTSLGVLLFGVATVAVLGVYEIGYIVNDAVTTRKEMDPTLRLSDEEMEWASRHTGVIVTVRWLLAGLLVLAVSFLACKAHIYLSNFVGTLLGIQILYLAYNHWRGRAGLVFFPFLVFFRYYGACLLTIPVSQIAFFFLWMFPTYPLPNLIEWSAKKRYAFPWVHLLSGRTDLFRVTYYLLALLVMEWVDRKTSAPPYRDSARFIVLYFALFRTAAYIAYRASLSIRQSVRGWNRQ